ncbi:hypothetical protein RvY_15897 [Ramazzottius varieornatus]|uniref:Uncharacterized protein n=1 Tax=Ramazzottius varieornatus TaxID=947166 RepID=A0A1D1VWI8_RAMVA|nr:hypothetical protein RvY_15897 [Ramazzottius varieornatus]
MNKYQGIGGWNGASLESDPPSLPAALRDVYRGRGTWSPAGEAARTWPGLGADAGLLLSGTSTPSSKSCMSSKTPKEGYGWLNQDNMLQYGLVCLLAHAADQTDNTPRSKRDSLEARNDGKYLNNARRWYFKTPSQAWIIRELGWLIVIHAAVATDDQRPQKLLVQRSVTFELPDQRGSSRRTN